MEFDAALNRERELFLERRDSEESAAQRHLFFATREATRVPGIPRETEARKIARAGVIGAFEAAGMAGFASHIVGEEVRTPLQWRNRCGLRRGAVFGLSHSLPQLSLLRPARRHGPMARGLHWVGASSRPGNGVPLVLDDTFWQCNATMGTLEVRARVGLYSNLEEHVHITRVSMLMPNAPSFPSSTT